MRCLLNGIFMPQPLSVRRVKDKSSAMRAVQQQNCTPCVRKYFCGSKSKTTLHVNVQETDHHGQSFAAQSGWIRSQYVSFAIKCENSRFAVTASPVSLSTASFALLEQYQRRPQCNAESTAHMSPRATMQIVCQTPSAMRGVTPRYRPLRPLFE